MKKENEKVKPDIIIIANPIMIKKPANNGFVAGNNQKNIVVSNFAVDRELNNRDIKVNSPVFNELGFDFMQKYERLQKLKIVGQSISKVDDSEMEALDEYLAEFVIQHFAIKEISNNEGELRNMIEMVASQNKISKYTIHFMLKLDNDSPLLIMMNPSGTPMYVDETIQMFSVLQVKGQSELLTEEKIMKVYNDLESQYNSPRSTFAFIIRISELSNELIVNLLHVGNKELRYGDKTLEQWIGL